MTACLLALDSSTERLALALRSPQGLFTAHEEGGQQSSARLVPAVLQLLAQGGCTLASLEAIAFARGPGAFTGLRTACAVAQGLALGAAKPVLALDSLMLVAEDARRQLPEAHEIWVAMDARMGEVYAGAYRWDGPEGWQVLQAPALYELEALRAAWQAAAPAVVAGSAINAFGARLLTGTAVLVPDERDRAGALLQVAQQAWQRGEAHDAAAAMPLYLRDKVALTTAERMAQRGQEAGR
jgi:tRNA threonylcarbamoyladenosine biosynthesis protein TsaB